MPDTFNPTKNGQVISPDTSRVSQVISPGRVQISLRISPDISRDLDSVVSHSPLSRNEWIEQAIEEKLTNQQQEESRLDRLERQLQALLEAVPPPETAAPSEVKTSQKPSVQPPETAAPKKRGAKPKLITHQGLSLSPKEWSDRLGIPARTIRYRLSKGWPVVEVLKVTK